MNGYVTLENEGHNNMTEWLAVVTITIFAVISPGPDFAMVSRNALLVERRVGLLTALGISQGVFVHVGYTLLGIGLLIKQSPALYEILKLVGAAYLIWLGVRMLQSSPYPSHLEEDKPVYKNWKALRIGFLTNALNPKTTIFVVSLFLQVVNPKTPLTMQIAYGAFIAGAHLVWFALVALFFSHPKIQQNLLASRKWIDRAFGIALIGFGIGLAFANK